ncbi:MAG: SPOR domain-containing protein [Candidatus Omnitrophota bacterium]
MAPVNMQRQQELFEEFVIKEKRKGRFFGAFKFKRSVFPQRSVIFSLSYETLIISLIGAVLAASVIFSLGVERGRNLKLSSGDIEKAVKTDLGVPFTPLDSKHLTGFTEQAEKAPAAMISKEAPESKQQMDVKPEKKEPEKVVFPKGDFIIQVASYKTRNSAEVSAARLKKLGEDAEILKKGSFFIVCVGSYADKASAQKKLSDLKRTYKDCYLRKR